MVSNARPGWFLLGGKWCVAALLLLALSLPLTTCQTRHGLQEHPVSVSLENFDMVLCFVWPLPFLLARLLIPAARSSLGMAIAELLLAFFAWCWLFVEVAAAAMISLGGITPGSGYELASSALVGYAVLTSFDLALAVLARRRYAVPAPDTG